MRVIVSPSQLHGTAEAPPSKSLMQRAVAAALMAKGRSVIFEPSFSHDGLSSLAAAGCLGAQIEELEFGLAITGGLNPVSHEINVMESGLALRLFTPIAALSESPITLVGSGSLLSRPIGLYEQVIPKLGGHISTNQGCVPVQVSGPLHGGKISIDGSLSGQFVSGLLMAAPLMPEGLQLEVQNLNSKPYVDMTLEVMAHFGIAAMHTDYQSFNVPAGQQYQATEIEIEGDWSGGAALLVAGALAGRSDYQVAGLDTTFTQADRMITGVLLLAGCKVMREKDMYRLQNNKLRGFSFDATDCPDLFPVLAALAVFCDKPSTITGTHRLTHKESNRAIVLQSEFAKAGIKIDLEDDRMTVHPAVVKACEIDSHNDHRIAMAAALLGLAGAPITVLGAECVNKSFPDFWPVLKSVGAQLHSKKD